MNALKVQFEAVENVIRLIFMTIKFQSNDAIFYRYAYSGPAPVNGSLATMKGRVSSGVPNRGGSFCPPG